MFVNNQYHLTYCTNIHSEKSWNELFEALKENIIYVKHKICPGNSFGIGLRLSDSSSKELLEHDNLMKFKKWLDENNLYVFTINGFPYGQFHDKPVKDNVHKPDWTTKEREEYTKRLCRILSVLLPPNIEGGISTSPLSYKPWHTENKKINQVYKTAALHLISLVEELVEIRKESGKIIHIDIEPEPDGLLEDSSEVVDFFTKYLLPQGKDYLMSNLSMSPLVAEQTIKSHIRVCYDICHFAIKYEDPKVAIERFEQAGIKIGKIQISSALKSEFNNNELHSQKIIQAFQKLIDPTYLHQVVEKNINNTLIQYRDLPEALANAKHNLIKEWRVHFHVPLFVETYDHLKSTQSDVLEVLRILKEKNITQHLEIETYTWEVLPESLKIEIKDSITRELEWVLNKIEVTVAHE